MSDHQKQKAANSAASPTAKLSAADTVPQPEELSTHTVEVVPSAVVAPAAARDDPAELETLDATGSVSEAVTLDQAQLEETSHFDGHDGWRDSYDSSVNTIAVRDADPDGSAGIELYDSRIGENAVADPLIGLVVADRYRIVERIGRGGMGIVYRVEHIRIGKLLAMKLLAGELSTNKEVVRRFKNEALTVSKLSSPHTVHVFDYGVWNHLTYLVMELVEGSDLSRVLRRDGPLPFERLGRLVLQVCSSIGEAHEKGIVHRDIKPENIMIVSDSRGAEVAKVLDFGLAKLRESQELNAVTLQGAVVGTPYYISPEQVCGEDVDGRSDIYSLGAVMYRGLTGCYPFQAKTPMGMFTKHLTEEPPSARERKPALEIPEGVSDAVRRCMAKDAAERFQTIEEVRDRIIAELQQLPLPSSGRSASGDSFAGDDLEPRRVRRRRSVAAVGAPEIANSAVATREQLEQYERKLRRTTYGAWGLLAVVLLGGVGGASYAYRESTRTLSGNETEPNNDAADANLLAMGQPITGWLGRRMEPGVADRDFYAFEVPSDGEATHLALTVTALPNMPMCSLLYKVGFQQPLAHYCTGRAGQDLLVPAVRVDPGEYLVTVTQDMTVDDDAPRHVLENVSDSYQLEVNVVRPSPTSEVEPNDRRELGKRMAIGGEVVGGLSWVGDEDFFCVDEAHRGSMRWHVVDGKRPVGTVLEVTPMAGEQGEPLVRVHASGAKPFGKPRLEADLNSPWTSRAFDASAGMRCLRLRLTSDPWVDRSAATSRPDATPYTVRVVPPAQDVSERPPGDGSRSEVSKTPSLPLPSGAGAAGTRHRGGASGGTQ